VCVQKLWHHQKKYEETSEHSATKSTEEEGLGKEEIADILSNL